MYKKASLIFLALLFSALCYAQHQRNLIVYNTTSTDCGPCSCMDSIFNNFIAIQLPNTIIVEFHEIGSNPDFSSYQGDSVVSTFRHNQLLEPSCFPNGFSYDVNYKALEDTLHSLYNQFPETPIGLTVESKEWNPETKKLNFDIKFKNDGITLNGDYWYNVILTEDNLIRDHRTLDSCSTPNRPHVPYDSTFINNYVVRKMVYWSNGTELTSPTWEEDEEFTKSCSVTLEDVWVPDNCHFVVNVYLKEDSLYQSPVLQAIKEKVTSASSILDPSAKSNIIKAYPNPVTGKCNIHFQLNDNSSYKLELINENGQLIKRISTGNINNGIYNTETSFDGLPAGIYFLQLKTKNGVSIKKIIKQ